jgi:hypothetical protein
VSLAGASCLYVGTVRHRRFAPVAHAFSYRLFMVYVDLAEVDGLAARLGRLLFTAEKGPALARLAREDHLGDPAVPLDRAVRDLVEARLGRRPEGPIRLLTHLRYLGHGFNPVSFFYCFRPGGAALDAIVAEVNNTPWGERWPYVLDVAGDPARAGRRSHRFRFEKAFHVSPFMRMEQEYDWRFSAPGPRLAVHMANREDGRALFDATLALERRPLGRAALGLALLAFPLVTVKVVAAIYWNALRLWWKRAPYVEHPRTPPGVRPAAPPAPPLPAAPHRLTSESAP